MSVSIYKLMCSESDKVYVGSTEKTLEERLKIHTMKSNKMASRHLVNPTIELIEECDIAIRFEREQHYIDSVGTVKQMKAGKVSAFYAIKNKGR